MIILPSNLRNMDEGSFLQFMTAVLTVTSNWHATASMRVTAESYDLNQCKGI